MIDQPYDVQACEVSPLPRDAGHLPHGEWPQELLLTVSSLPVRGYDFDSGGSVQGGVIENRVALEWRTV